MNFINTNIPDVLIIEPKVFGDNRGFFMESFNQKQFDDAIGRKVDFVQDNHSKSKKGVLRGLHFQADPFMQGKLVRCIAGEVYDVAVDIRKNSSTFGRHVGIKLSAENKRQLWIPDGFAHGFLVLSETAEFVYKTTKYYNPESEWGINFQDPELNIDWPMARNEILLSDKDLNAKFLSDYIKDIK